MFCNFHKKNGRIMAARLMNEKTKNLKTVLTLFIVSLFARIPFMSSSPQEWDSCVYLTWCENLFKTGSLPFTSMQYAKPLYNILTYLPCYLLYLFTGKILFEKPAIFTSVLLGALSVIPMFYIGKYLFKERNIAIVSALLFSFCPVVWLFSEELMSDIPSIFFVLSALALELRWFKTRRNKYLVLSVCLLGLSLLVRFSNIFVLPAYFFLILIYSVRHRSYSPLLISVLIPLPCILYFLWNVLAAGISVKFFLSVNEQLSMSLRNLFSFNSWLNFVKFIISSVTITLSCLFLVSFLFIFLEIKRWKEVFYSNTLINYIFLLLWIIPFSLYWRTLPRVSQIVGYMILITPPIILLAADTIFKLAGKFNYFIEKRIFRIGIFGGIVIFLLSVSLDHMLMHRVGFFELTKNFLLFINRTNNLFICGFLLAVAVLSCGGYQFVLWAAGYFKREEHRINFFMILVTCILLMHFVAYSLPVLILNHKKIQHEKAEALWFGKNTPENSLIIAGHEFPFAQYYARPRRISFVVHTDTAIREAKKALLNKEKVFASSNDYIKYYKSLLEQVFSFEVIGTIPSASIRNQEDNDFTYINYFTLKKSYDIDIYELKPYLP
jgi:hypothetical protein